MRQDTLTQFAEKFRPCGFRPAAFYPCYGTAEATLFITGGAKHLPPKTLQVETQGLEQNRVAIRDASRSGIAPSWRTADANADQLRPSLAGHAGRNRQPGDAIALR